MEYKFKTLPTVTPNARWHSACLLYQTPKFQEWLKPNLERAKQIVKENKWNLNTLKMRFCFWLECSIHSDYESADFDNLIELYRISQSLPRGATLEKFTVDYGPIWGPVRWQEYCDRQSYTNTLEYKAKTYNMSESEFKKYNKSRASTEKNFIKRHGEVEGKRLWEEYKERQSYTKSLQYQIDLHGEEEGRKKFAEISAKKVNSLENFIQRHGEERGTELFIEYQKRTTCYSEVAATFFSIVDRRLRDMDVEVECRYLPKTYEYFIHADRVFFYDFVIPELKICVEFNGDIFHANPELYKPEDRPNPYSRHLTAQDIWNFDKMKNDHIISDGFDLEIVWEKDYNKNLESEIERIVNAIKDKYNRMKSREEF